MTKVELSRSYFECLPRIRGRSIFCVGRFGVGENRVELIAAEFEVLKWLAAHPGWVYSRQQIMEQLWDGEFYGKVRTADVHVRNIRRKIETDPKNPRYVLTVRGMGYKFAEIS
jgi:DNA-binding response OmpR family regulator